VRSSVRQFDEDFEKRRICDPQFKFNTDLEQGTAEAKHIPQTPNAAGHPNRTVSHIVAASRIYVQTNCIDRPTM